MTQIPGCDTPAVKGDNTELFHVLLTDKQLKGYWAAVSYHSPDPMLCPTNQINVVVNSELLISVAKKYFRFNDQFVTWTKPVTGVMTYRCSLAPDMSKINIYLHMLIWRVSKESRTDRIEILRNNGDGDCGNRVVRLSILIGILMGIETQSAPGRRRRDLVPVTLNMGVNSAGGGSDLENVAAALDVEDINVQTIFTNQIMMQKYLTKFVKKVTNDTDNNFENIVEFEEKFNQLAQTESLLSWVGQVKTVSENYLNTVKQGADYSANLYDQFEKEVISNVNILYYDHACGLVQGQVMCKLSLPTFKYDSESEELITSYFGDKIEMKKSFVFRCVPRGPEGTSVRNHRVVINHNAAFSLVQLDNGHVLKKGADEVLEKQVKSVNINNCEFNGNQEQIIMACYQRVILIKQEGAKVVLNKFEAQILNIEDFPIQLNGMAVSLIQVRDQIRHSHTLMVANSQFTAGSETPTNFIQYLEEDDEDGSSWLGELEQLEMIWQTYSGQKYIIATGVIMFIVLVLGVSCLCYVCYPRYKRWRNKDREDKPVKYKAPVPSAPPIEDSQPEVEEERVKLVPASEDSEKKVKFEKESGAEQADKGTNVRREKSSKTK